MDPRRDLLDLPQALRALLEKGGPEYDKLVRQTRWGDGPIYVIGSDTAAALLAGYAFEALVGVPAVVRAPEDFRNYTLSALRPRSIILAIESPGEIAATLEAVRAAKSRDAKVLTLTDDLQGELAKTSDTAFPVYTGEAHRESRSAGICRHVAASYLGFAAARALKRPSDFLRDLEEEFHKLPEHVEWAYTQLSEGVRALAAQLESAAEVEVVGGGFYYPAAWFAAETLRDLKGHHLAQARNARWAAIPEDGPAERPEMLLLLSGSRCRAKKIIHAIAERAKRSGTNLLALTDKNDPEVTRRAALAILLPILSEEVGSLLTLALLDWVACQRGRAAAGGHERGRTEPRPHAGPS